MHITKIATGILAAVLLLFCIYCSCYLILSYPSGLVDYGPYKARSYNSKPLAFLFQPAAAIESLLTNQKIKAGWRAAENSQN
jgi:hypothetical protein